MLARCLRRRHSIEPALGQCIVFAGKPTLIQRFVSAGLLRSDQGFLAPRRLHVITINVAFHKLLLRSRS